MADGFIVRRGGKAEEVLQTLSPTITKVSETSTSITFTLKNNDPETATLVYRYSSLTGDGESISLATDTTSSNITVSGITIPGTLFVTANATGKIKSNVVEAEYTITFTEATGGDIEEYNLDNKRYRSHTFTSDGDFTVTTLGNGDRNQADFLVVAGGGGGGSRSTTGTTRSAGGGGAGGYQTSLGTSGAESSALQKITLTQTTFSIDVGAGGDGFTTSVTGPTNGSNSKFSTITSIGGGYGSPTDNIGGVHPNGAAGGSGGGAVGAGTGGLGTSNQGRNGGNAGGGSNLSAAGGGGGGAKDAGVNGANDKGGNGGDGLSNILRTGSSETRGGGGGGNAGNGAGLGGAGGGGNSGGASGAGQNGQANTGGGGGAGSAATNGGNGGSGIVVIRYEIAPSV
jgi:hypothetical protein